jgi:hypothetical protein
MTKSSCSIPMPPPTLGALAYATTPESVNDQIGGGRACAGAPVAFTS